MNHLLEHWDDVLTGAVSGMMFWSILGHAVNTFPSPKNPYGLWMLNVVQYAVGQRAQVTARTAQLKAAEDK